MFVLLFALVLQGLLDFHNCASLSRKEKSLLAQSTKSYVVSFLHYPDKRNIKVRETKNRISRHAPSNFNVITSNRVKDDGSQMNLTNTDVKIANLKRLSNLRLVSDEGYANKRRHLDSPFLSKTHKEQESKSTQQKVIAGKYKKWTYNNNKPRERRDEPVIEDRSYNSGMKELLQKIASSEDKISSLSNVVENETWHKERAIQSSDSTIEKKINDFSKVFATVLLKPVAQFVNASTGSTSKENSAKEKRSRNSNVNRKFNKATGLDIKTSPPLVTAKSLYISQGHIITDVRNAKNPGGQVNVNYGSITTLPTEIGIATRYTKLVNEQSTELPVSAKHIIDEIIPLLITLLDDLKDNLYVVNHTKIPKIIEVTENPSFMAIPTQKVPFVQPSFKTSDRNGIVPMTELTTIRWIVKSQPVIMQSSYASLAKVNQSSIDDEVDNIFEDTVLRMFDRLREVNNKLSRTENSDTNLIISRQVEEEVSKYSVWIFLLIFVLLFMMVYFSCTQCKKGCCTGMPIGKIHYDSIHNSNQMKKTVIPVCKCTRTSATSTDRYPNVTQGFDSIEMFENVQNLNPMQKSESVETFGFSCLNEHQDTDPRHLFKCHRDMSLR